MRILLLVLIAACGSKSQETTPPPANADEIAQCLTEKGTKMYGAWWCPHCAAQKETFGESFQYVTYIECANPDRTETDVCRENEINNYPTWIFSNGERLIGEQTLVTLAQKSGC